ncbi:MAG TPA: 5-(carboxyamino)imidazole ribonucleotide mutase [bacterium]|nr:5-(carboxyamino)imidazole ribonucleotide mutase [bacterium]
MTIPRVAIILGSESDRAVMDEAAKTLAEFGVDHEVIVASAHRTPDLLDRYVRAAEERGIRVVIAAAGGAAHLAGAVAARTVLPVIGVPLEATGLGGLDALLSTVQMPPGIPVATVSIGTWGARNAAFLAVEVLGVSDELLREQLRRQRAKVAAAIESAAREITDRGLIDRGV